MPLDRLLTHGRELVDSLGRDGSTLAAIQDLLIYGYPRILHALLALTALAAAWALPTLLRRARRVGTRGWIAALAVFDAALALRAFWAPHLPQVYFDEISFLSTADAMARYGVNALIPADGAPLGSMFHPCPQAWQYLVSRLYCLLGVHVDLAFALAALLSALTVLLLFLAVFEMTGRERPALAAAAMLAVLPVHLRLSGSAALETASLFFLAAFLYVLTAWMREHRGPLLLLAACLAAWFVNVRMENGIALFPLLLVYFAVFCPSQALRGGGRRLALMGAAALVVIFAIPAFLSDYYGLATRFYFFYAPPDVIHADIRSNLRGNLIYWIDNAIHPAAFTLLAAAGLIAGWRAGWRRLAAFWAVWFAALVAFYTLNPSCDFALRHTLDSWRTALHPALGLLILAGIGVDALAARLRRPGPILLTAALAAICATAPLFWSGFIQDRHLWMVQWEQMRAMRPLLGPDARVLIAVDPTVMRPHPSSLAYEMGCTTGLRPTFFSLPPTGTRQPPIMEAARHWTQVEKRRVFLYHFGTGTEEDALTMAALHRLFNLRAVSGRIVSRYHATFALYRVEEPAVEAAR